MMSFDWLAARDVALAQAPILLAEKGWAIGYILVALCIFMGLLAVCIPRVRRVEVPDDEPAPQQGAQGAAPGRPAPFGQQPYGQMGQMGPRPGMAPQPGFGQKPAFGQQPMAPVGGGPLKSRKVAGLLGLFLGGWGVHRFYLGYTGIGAAMIPITLFTCGMGACWGVIEGIMMLTGGGIDRDAEGRPLGP